MAVCTFLGHREVYDTDIESRVQAAVDRVIRENKSVDFLFYYTSGDSFFDCCLLSTLRARTRYPEKVTISLVLHYGRFPVPDCMIDRIISLELPETKRRDCNMPYKQMQRWIITHSTHIISYTYDRLYGSECCALKAKIPDTVEVINIANPETEELI